MTNATATNARSIELDTVLDESFDDWSARVRAYGVEAALLIWNGPGGGNPYIRYTGEPEALKRMLIENFEMSAEEAAAEIAPRR